MSFLSSFEAKCVALSGELPSLPKDVVAWLVRWAWLIAAIVGVLFLLDAFGFLAVARSFGGMFSSYFGGTGVVFDLYLAAALTTVYGIWYLSSVSGLRAHSARGWRMLFHASLVQLVCVVVILFLAGIGNLISLIEVAVAWYLLFQVRPAFVGDQENV